MLLKLPHAVRAGRSFIRAKPLVAPSSSSLFTASTPFAAPARASTRSSQQTRPFSLSWKSIAGMASEDPEKTKEVRKYLQQSHDRIFENNKKWADEMKAKKPEFFKDLTAGQAPEYLWIGTYTPSPYERSLIHRNHPFVDCWRYRAPQHRHPPQHDQME
jgi:carbonic anhydrase